MDFLGDVLVSSQDQSILGVMLTHFDPDCYTERAAVQLYPMDKLHEAYSTLTPRGFKLNNGVLLSDSSNRRIVTDSVFDYIRDECANLVPPVADITDLVLLGVTVNGFVIANMDDIENISSIDELGIMIPFRNFKVSASSFNIYSSYKDSNDSYKTFSLLNVEDGSMNPFFAAFPLETDMSKFPEESLVFKGNTKISNIDMAIYQVSLGLVGFNANVGEAFLNYLAYNVSFCNIGEKIIREIQYVTPKVPAIPPEPSMSKQKRYPKVNVSIQHIYKESMLNGIVKHISDSDAMVDFIKAYPEAAVTYQWVQKIYNSPWYKESENKLSEEESIYITCTNLLSECRQTNLKFSLELLTQRYYIYLLGMIGDTLGPILKGGGVSGESIKRFSIR